MFVLSGNDSRLPMIRGFDVASGVWGVRGNQTMLVTTALYRSEMMTVIPVTLVTPHTDQGQKK